MTIIKCSCGSIYRGHSSTRNITLHIMKFPDHYEVSRKSELNNIHRKKENSIRAMRVR